MDRGAEAFLFGLRARGVVPGLAPTRAVLDALGAPDRAVPVLQIVGTVGKGSTAAMAASVLEAAGVRCGLFTSPHLVRYRERFVASGEMVDDAAIEAALARVRGEVPWAAGEVPAPDGLRPLTFFEWSTVLACLLFRDAGARAMVLECGLGGRWDATTACRADVVAVSRIGLDHMATLGDTVAAIAAEKAAAIREGRPVITVDQVPDAMAVVEARAREMEAPLSVVRPDRVDGFEVPLPGAHQVENAALAIAAIEALAASARLPVDSAAMHRGIAATRLAGRLEQIRPGLWLDGAHNRPGTEALAAALPSITGTRRVHLVFAVLAGRDPVSLLEPLLPFAETVTLTRAGGDRALDPDGYADAIRARHPAVHVVAEVAEALAAAPPPALVCGSLYLVGEVRALCLDTVPDPGDPRASAPTG